MASHLNAALEKALADATGRPAKIAERRPLGGGCINNAAEVVLDDGRRFFAKSNDTAAPHFFESEAQGLEALGAVGALRVPEVVAHGTDSHGHQFLVLELLESGGRAEGFFADFGRQLAKLHQRSAELHTKNGGQFGFPKDNFIGSTHQPNRWTDDWVEFWRRQRLGYQLDMARRNGVSDRRLENLGERLMDRLDELIGEPDEPPCLLHGDLWSGNFMVDENGAAVLIDPAVYYGRREADLAMTRLFGGFDASFYAAYEEVWPLAPDAEERIEIYKLYHLLNHLNLFGGGYHAGCLNVLKRFA